MAQKWKLTPILDHHGTKALNLTVLQRIDPFVEEILMTVSHVTFYEFNIELTQWSRKDVEGPLFVVKRNTQPRFQFIVMNRRNTENLVEDLLGDFEYEVQLPYLLYRNEGQEVNGIWFYNSQDCEAVANLLSRILNAYSKVPPKYKISSIKSEFEELETVPSLSVIEGPLEPPSSSASASVPDVPDESFMKIFSDAMNIGNPLQPSLLSAPIALSTHPPITIPSVLQTVQSVPSLPTSCPPLMPPLDVHQYSTVNSNPMTNLVKPSFFQHTPSPALITPPLPSSIPTAPLLHPSVTMQRPYGTPLLQSFPPPTLPASLVPNYSTVIRRDKVRDAFLRLVQNNDFIDMVYREMQNSHHS